jgi:hypothetical protein
VNEHYLSLFRKYESSYKWTRLFNNMARWTVALGSILITAFIAIENSLSEQCEKSPSRGIFYGVFIGSVLITTVNTIAELTQLSKQVYTYAAAHHMLEHEGWLFMLLQGRYRRYSSHRKCWSQFLYRVEKIHQTAASQRLLLYQQQQDSIGGADRAQPGFDLRANTVANEARSGWDTMNDNEGCMATMTQNLGQPIHVVVDK